ncbi:hypothetical protein M9Y10_032234 [Tritrichomonas musculus]|uniref:Uncharacterized protein n=1 Tax=Tritrichomonas musculus TaxID=1915356 RepID=A0ABR2H0B6_9EUKA
MHPLREIQRLKAQIEQIRIQFHLLLSLDDPVSIKYIEEIEKATEERYLDSEKAHKNEEDSAQLHYDGAMYQMEFDDEISRQKITERLIKLIKFRYKVIEDHFPDSCKYFRSKGCKFLTDMTEDKSEESENNKYIVETSQKPLIQDEDIKKSQEKHNPKEYYVNDSVLYHGNEQFSIGSNVIMIIPLKGDNPKCNIPCTIRDINPQYVEVKVNIEENMIKRIKIEAFIHKICRFEHAKSNSDNK